MLAMTERLPAVSLCCRFIALVLLSLLACGRALADPPGRVGRIAWFSGQLLLLPADSAVQTPALVNWPLTSGDSLSTGTGSRAEVQIGSAMLQLDADSAVDFVQVDDRGVRLQLVQGRMILRTASNESAKEFEIDTAHGRFRPRDAGTYRIDAGRATSSATVLAGLLDFAANDLVLAISAGQRAVLWIAGGTAHQLLAPENDEFAVWSSQRELPRRQPVPAGLVSTEMTGSADLAAYGTWFQSEEYGPIWFPRGVSSDWAPYRRGRWAWVEPWGWTWVADEPWGFAPYHYGRWAHYRGAWGWVPGDWVARPVYAPALVAWVGSPAGHRGAAIGQGPTVGWFPLAPRELYVPPYRSGPAHWQAVNRGHFDNAARLPEALDRLRAGIDDGRHANRSVPQALTIVDADRLRRGVHVGAATSSVGDRGALATLPTQTRPPIAAGGVGETTAGGAARWPHQVRQWPAARTPGTGVAGEAHSWSPKAAQGSVPSAPPVEPVFRGRPMPNSAGATPWPERSDRATPVPGSPVTPPPATAPRVGRFPADGGMSTFPRRADEAFARRRLPMAPDLHPPGRPDTPGVGSPAGQPGGQRSDVRDARSWRDHRKDRDEHSKMPMRP